jgi:RNA ligase (TIGR02306 family)
MAELKVTVEKVREVMHHPNADRLDLVTVRGWQVIVGRDQYKVGDLCVYVPIDSVLPVDLAHEWDVAKYLRGNMRIKTIKLRQSISQGLVVGLNQVEPLPIAFREGDDLTDYLNIKKWVPQGKPGRSMRLQQGQKMNPARSTPWFPRYTNIDHLNNNPMAFQDDDWVVVNEKRHGTNARMGYVKKSGKSLVQRLLEVVHRVKRRLGWRHCFYTAHGRYLHVGSHNVIREYHPEDLYWKAALKLQLTAKAKLPYDKVFFYEVSGPSIQKGFDYGQEEDGFIVEVIDIYDSARERYLSPTEVTNFCYRWGLPEAPTMCVGYWNIIENTYKSYASGKATGADHIREGVVLKKLGQGTRKIFKYISPEYLIHQGKKKPEDETEWH